MYNEERVMISLKRYQDLLASEERLLALECAGVDNWEGYRYAMEMLPSYDSEDEDDEYADEDF